jgi:hypothetical protein
MISLKVPQLRKDLLTIPQQRKDLSHSSSVEEGSLSQFLS